MVPEVCISLQLFIFNNFDNIYFYFFRCLPPYVCKFFEMCLMVTADHGPAVSGAHNTIVCARAGKDLVSSLVSGLLTIVRFCFKESSAVHILLINLFFIVG